MGRRDRFVRRLGLAVLVCVLGFCLVACSGVQVRPKGEMVGGVSVGGRR